MNSLSLEKYLNNIKVLNPLEDSKFKYNKENWSKLESKYVLSISDFENKFISRSDIIKAFNDYYFNSGDYMRAFLLTMIWGFGDTGYGTHRTNLYVTDEGNITLIKKAIDTVLINDLEKAFKYLKDIKGLGVSYITKVLYFATRGANISNYALIYDIRVASALVQLTTPKEIFEIVSISPSSKFNNYQKYNSLIHSLADTYKVEAEALEMFLFEQKF